MINFMRILKHLLRKYDGNLLVQALGRVDGWLYGSVRLAAVHHKEGLRSCSGLHRADLAQ